MTVAAEQPPGDLPRAGDGLRLQVLATEHWSLLATRSMTWSEVMSRIAIHLTVASASLVVLALVVQASGFGTAFRVLSIGLASVVLLLGTLTAVRVRNASEEDAVLLLGMNRLRAAYLDIDPGLEKYLVTSAYDDKAGVMSTYTLGIRRSMPRHVLGSTNLFMTAVNAVVAGTLGSLVASTVTGMAWAIAVVGVVSGVAYVVATVLADRQVFARDPVAPRFPSP